MEYKVLADYRSGSSGPFTKGQTVDLDPHVAEWVNRDSPGTLESVQIKQNPPQRRRKGA